MTLTPAQLHTLVESDRISGWYFRPPVCLIFEHLILFSQGCSKEMFHYAYLKMLLIWNFTFNLNWSIAYFLQLRRQIKKTQNSYLEILDGYLFTRKASLVSVVSVAQPLTAAPVWGQLELTWTVPPSLCHRVFGEVLRHTEQAVWCGPPCESWVVLPNSHDNQT